jgi:hypothetical protein
MTVRGHRLIVRFIVESLVAGTRVVTATETYYRVGQKYNLYEISVSDITVFGTPIHITPDTRAV